MNRRMRPSLSSSSSPSSCYQRFLRPGALARLRDSRIRPRSATIVAVGPSQPSSPAPVAVDTPAAVPGSPPCFSARTFGPRFLQRKKLLAAKAIRFFASQAGVDSPVADSVGVDLLVAH